ncbi:MAG: PAS domain S-box protein [Burkholderiales bacterium]|nr:PAS domain S-box protein [Burkholderiales bacterium]
MDADGETLPWSQTVTGLDDDSTVPRQPRGLVLAWLAALQWQARRVAASTVRTMANELRRGTWEAAVAGLREPRRLVPSAFGDLATQVEGVLGESDRRWQARAELSSDWYWETDERGRLSSLSADSPLVKPAGRALGDLLGRRHDELSFCQAPAIGWDAFHDRLERHETLREIEFEVLGLGARERGWVAISGRPRWKRDGRFAGYEGVGHDITEPKAAYHRLQASEQRYAVMAGLSADWYWSSDAQHRMAPPDAESTRRFGSLAKQITGMAPWDAFPEALPAAQWQAHRDDWEAHRPFKALEIPLPREDDGRMVWISMAGAPRLDAQGLFMGYHGVGRDITLRKMAEQLLLQHNRELQLAVAARTRELEMANRDLDAFARHLAHEMRTPIGHVQGLAELLRQRLADRLTPSEAELLDLQARAAQDMLATLDALLQLARSSSDAIERCEVDLSALAAEVIATLPPIERAAPVHWEVQPELSAWASAGQMRIVLHNLLGNAAKFTRRVAHPMVQLMGHRDENDQLVLRVVDNGAGFDETRAERLFQPFQRLHRQDDYQGTGIGLTIVQRIVQRHGGTVSASGSPGKGAVFEFNLGQREAPRTH